MGAEPSTSLGRGLGLLEILGGSEATLRGGLGVVEIAKLARREKSQVSHALHLGRTRAAASPTPAPPASRSRARSSRWG